MVRRHPSWTLLKAPLPDDLSSVPDGVHTHRKKKKLTSGVHSSIREGM
jgi:hypothetical protein